MQRALHAGQSEYGAEPVGNEKRTVLGKGQKLVPIGRFIQRAREREPHSSFSPGIDSRIRRDRVESEMQIPGRELHDDSLPAIPTCQPLAPADGVEDGSGVVQDAVAVRARHGLGRAEAEPHIAVLVGDAQTQAQVAIFLVRDARDAK